MTPQCKSRLIKASVVAGVCGAVVILAYAIKSRAYFLDHWEEEQQE